MKAESQANNKYQVLAKARLQKGWMLSDVAEKLSLSETAVSHIEEGDSSYFPRGPYFSGNLKRYCACLDIDSASLLDAYYAEKVPDHLSEYQEPQMHKRQLTSAYQHKKHKTFYGLACAVIVVVLVGAMSTQTIVTDMPVIEKAVTPSSKADERVTISKTEKVHRSDLQN